MDVVRSTDTLWTTLLGGSVSAIAYLIGGIDHLVIALAIMMAVDYVTGVMGAFTRRVVSSKSAFRGLMKKASMCLAVVVANQLDIVVSGGDFMRNAMIMFLIGSEGISFIENLGRLGVNVPKHISKAFAQMNGEDKEGE